MQFKLIPERPEFVAYTWRLAERPALKRATKSDAALMAASDRPAARVDPNP